MLKKNQSGKRRDWRKVILLLLCGVLAGVILFNPIAQVVLASPPPQVTIPPPPPPPPPPGGKPPQGDGDGRGGPQPTEELVGPGQGKSAKGAGDKPLVLTLTLDSGAVVQLTLPAGFVSGDQAALDQFVEILRQALNKAPKTNPCSAPGMPAGATCVLVNPPPEKEEKTIGWIGSSAPPIKLPGELAEQLGLTDNRYSFNDFAKKVMGKLSGNWPLTDADKKILGPIWSQIGGADYKELRLAFLYELYERLPSSARDKAASALPTNISPSASFKIGKSTFFGGAPAVAAFWGEFAVSTESGKREAMRVLYGDSKAEDIAKALGLPLGTSAITPAEGVAVVQVRVGLLAAPLRVAGAKAPSREAAVMEAFTIEGWLAGTGHKLKDLVEPLSFNITYTDENLALAGGDPNEFVIASYDEAAGEWIALETVVDPNTRTVTAESDHLSWFAFAAYTGVEVPPAPETLPETGTRSNGLPLVAVALGLALMGLGGGLAYQARRRESARP